MSQDLKSLISALLKLDQTYRTNCENALEHKFFQKSSFPKQLPVKYILHRPDKEFYQKYDAKETLDDAELLQQQKNAAFQADLLNFMNRGKDPRRSQSTKSVFKTRLSQRDLPMIRNKQPKKVKLVKRLPSLATKVATSGKHPKLIKTHSS